MSWIAIFFIDGREEQEHICDIPITIIDVLDIIINTQFVILYFGFFKYLILKERGGRSQIKYDLIIVLLCVHDQ